jgi:hypothetical protein
MSTGMAIRRSYRWRKVTDIGCQFALFELLEDERPILDIGFSDAGTFEVSFNRKIAGGPIEWGQLRKMIEDGTEACRT